MNNQYGEINQQYQDQEGSQEDVSGEGSQDDGGDNKQGGKRRSKNDNAGRDFKCKYCDKTYLSYPALYTHMKQKHSKGPDGELRNPPTSGRGRGRPRKNPYQRLDPRTEDFFKAPEREGGPVDPLACFNEIYNQIFSYQSQTTPSQLQKNMYEYPIYKHLIQFSQLVDSEGQLKESALAPIVVQTEENKINNDIEANARNGDQVHVGQDDEENQGAEYEGGEGENDQLNAPPQNNTVGGGGAPPQYQQTIDNSNYQPPNISNAVPPMNNQYPPQQPVQYNGGQQQYQPPTNGMNNTQNGIPNNSNNLAANLSSLPPSANPSKWQRNYDNLTDKDRNEMLVDEIFALYLYRMSNRINQTYYKTVLAYVIFFRECLNDYGWGKKIESEGIRLENNPVMKLDIETKQFCLVNNAEHAPEICNEFVTVYMEYKKNIFDIPKHDQIDLTINLCHWLFECQFTCSKLTMIA